MPSFSGRCPRIVIPALSSPPMRDFILAQKRSNILESDGRFVHLERREASRRASIRCVVATLRDAPFVSARFEQIIEDQAENVIRRNKRAVAIENSESVGVAVSRQSRERFLLEHRFFQRRKIFFRRVGAGAVKQHVPIRANRSELSAMDPRECDRAIPPRIRAARRKRNFLSPS